MPRPSDTCCYCLEKFEPKSRRDEEGIPIDKRPVRSRKCSDHLCRGCLESIFAQQTNRKTFDCPSCRAKFAFHKDYISIVDSTFCALLQVPNWQELDFPSERHQQQQHHPQPDEQPPPPEVPPVVELPRGSRNRQPPNRFHEEQPKPQRRRVSSPTSRSPSSSSSSSSRGDTTTTTSNEDQDDHFSHPSRNSPQNNSVIINDEAQQSDGTPTLFHESDTTTTTTTTTSTQVNNYGGPALSSAIDNDTHASSDDDDEELQKEQFMSKNLLHVNSFLKTINGSRRSNRGFGAFIASSCICFWYAPTSNRYVALQQQALSQDDTLSSRRRQEKICRQLKDEGHEPSRVNEINLWHTHFRVGDFVLMRHEYNNCPHIPTRLLRHNDNNNNNNNNNTTPGDDYIGPVYVIGIITQSPFQQQQEEDCNEEENIAQELSRRIPDLSVQTSTELLQNNVASFCRVKFLKMGYKKNLEDATNRYIVGICQATIKNICQIGGSRKTTSWKTNTTPERVRHDLWTNATIRITANDFDDDEQM